MVQVIAIDPEEGARFDDIVSKTSALVKFYNPGCIHCKNMKQAWIDLGKKLQDKYEGDIALIEVHSDALPQIKCEAAKEVQGYPTIIQVLKGGKKGAEYTGNRSADDMLEFVISKLGVKEKITGGGKGKKKRYMTRKSSRSRSKSRSRSRSGGKRHVKRNKSKTRKNKRRRH